MIKAGWVGWGDAGKKWQGGGWKAVVTNTKHRPKELILRLDEREGFSTVSEVMRVLVEAAIFQ